MARVLEGFEYDRQVGGDIYSARRAFEGRRLKTDHDRSGRLVLVTAGVAPSPVLDIGWLKAASAIYDISDDINDFVINEIPACQADLPNRNLDAFPYSELVKFRPVLGRIAYQSFKGKATNANHDNRDPKKAKGVIFDSYMEQINGHWHVTVLAGWSRSKDPRLAQRILEKKDAGYSMACLIGGAKCSVCGFFSQGNVTCKHINGGTGKGTIQANGRQTYELLVDLNFHEISHVEDRADIDAIQKWAR